VLHDLNQAVRYAQRLVAVRAGEILADGAPSAVFTRELVRDLYDVESRVSDIEIAGRCTKLCLPERVAKKAAVQ
jgi:ferrichrome ABC superfamily ATP binding cassette transporter, ABC protein